MIKVLLLFLVVVSMRSGMPFRFARSPVGSDKLSQRISNVSLKRSYGKTQNLQMSSPSSNRGSYYITTPIYYVNGQPHLGHAYTSVMADIISRYRRKFGDEVFFLTGTDEHGQKVEMSAKNANKSPLQFANEVSEKFQELTSQLNCKNDVFFRTTESRHYEAVTALWKRLEAADQIYLGSYEGWYSVRDEAFYSELELVDGKAPTGAEVQWVKEESYFFRLSQWTEKLLAFYEQHPDFIAPASRRNEVISFLKSEGGLTDLSISRTSFNWGIPVPGNPRHVIYVWLDALTNYLTALGYPDTQSPQYRQFWPANVHLVGKDILRFHAIFWPAFLLAAGLEPPQKIFAHGWWTREGQKMSKSVGNVVDPFLLLERYGVDYLRYFLASEINFGNDGDFSTSSFQKKINELADDLGNLLQRVLSLLKKHCEGQLPVRGSDLTAEDQQLLQQARAGREKIWRCLQELQVKGICDVAVEIARESNRYINQQEPWKLAKTDRRRMETVLSVLYEVLRILGIYFEPIIPQSSERLLQQLGVPSDFTSLDSVDRDTPAGTRIGTPSILFPKLKEEENILNHHNL